MDKYFRLVDSVDWEVECLEDGSFDGRILWL